MFDTVLGLPVHILVLHAVVVLGPLAALLALGYAARPAWRPALKWPVALGALATGFFGLLTGQSGEALAHRLLAVETAPAARALIRDHTEAGDTAQAVSLIFMVVALVVVFWALPASGPSRAGLLGPAAAVVLALASLGVLGGIAVAGHTGAKAAWADTVASTANVPAGEGGD